MQGVPGMGGVLSFLFFKLKTRRRKDVGSLKLLQHVFRGRSSHVLKSDNDLSWIQVN